MNLYVVRHAESEANEKNILASRMDFPLSAAGEKQVNKVARAFLEDHRPDLVVSSPLLRARQTAEVFAKLSGAPHLVREELTEQNLGQYAGKTYAQLDAEPEYCHDRAARWDWEPGGGGESYRMIARRVRPFFEWLETRKEKDILVVSHAVTMRMIRGHLEDSLPLYPETIAKNGEVWKTAYQGLGAVHEIESLIYDDQSPARRA